MKKTLKILIVEDVPSDAKLIQLGLRKTNKEFESRVVQDEKNFLNELETFQPDLILSGYSMPQFTGLDALEITKKKCPEIPFIIVSGSLDEETFVKCLRRGAWDYVIKEHLIRLGYAVMNALKLKAENDKKKLAQEALRESEENFRNFVETSADLVFRLSKTGRIDYVSPRVEDLYGYHPDELIGKHLRTTTPVGEVPRAIKALNMMLTGKPLKNFEINQKHKVGRIIPMEINAVPVYQSGKIVGFQGIMRDITERKQAEEELKQNHENLQRILTDTIQAMATVVEKRDPYTAGHQRRVSKIAGAIATEMGLSKGQIEGIRTAGGIHDLGKIVVPAEILSKPGRINEHEFGIIKSHPQVGFEILKEIKFPWPIAQIVLQHHEGMDGSGYPQGISGEDILLEARILAVADVIEAMSSHRPYRPALGINKALEEIVQKKGTFYDRKVVDACLKIFEENGFEFE